MTTLGALRGLPVPHETLAMPCDPDLLLAPSLLLLRWSMPNRRPVSVTVTRMLTIMRMMMIQVIALILASATESDRISARSKNTRQRSLSTLIRGSISRYSRIASYSGCSVGSESQKKLGTSRILDAIRMGEDPSVSNERNPTQNNKKN